MTFTAATVVVSFVCRFNGLIRPASPVIVKVESRRSRKKMTINLGTVESLGLSASQPVKRRAFVSLYIFFYTSAAVVEGVWVESDLELRVKEVKIWSLSFVISI